MDGPSLRPVSHLPRVRARKLLRALAVCVRRQLGRTAVRQRSGANRASYTSYQGPYGARIRVTVDAVAPGGVGGGGPLLLQLFPRVRARHLPPPPPKKTRELEPGSRWQCPRDLALCKGKAIALGMANVSWAEPGSPRLGGVLGVCVRIQESCAKSRGGTKRL